MMSINQNEIDRITKYLDLHAPPKQADLAFVFGSMALVPVQIAAKLYWDKIVNRIVVTGGINRKSQKREADEHRTFLLEQGVPESCIIAENQSTNTRENVVFAWREIEANHANILPIQSIVIVAKWYHSRRAAMTLRCNLPQGIRYYMVTYPLHNISQDNWWQNEIGLHYVLKEWHSIPKYLQQGHLAEVIKENGAYE